MVTVSYWSWCVTLTSSPPWRDAQIAPSATASPRKPRICWSTPRAHCATRISTADNAVTVIDRGLHEIRFEQTSKGKIARQLIALISIHLKDTTQNHA